MRELAVGRMTVDEFLDLEDGADTRYGLVEGQPVAMASGTPEHNEIAFAIALASRSRNPAKSSRHTEPVRARSERLLAQLRARRALTCKPRDKNKKAIEAPRLIVEVLSPSTASNDRGDKFDFYRAIPTVEEILFVASTTQRIEVWRRVDGPYAL